jgi:hypothetical protein
MNCILCLLVFLTIAAGTRTHTFWQNPLKTENSFGILRRFSILYLKNTTKIIKNKVMCGHHTPTYRDSEGVVSWNVAKSDRYIYKLIGGVARMFGAASVVVVQPPPIRDPQKFWTGHIPGIFIGCVAGMFGAVVVVQPPPIWHPQKVWTGYVPGIYQLYTITIYTPGALDLVFDKSDKIVFSRKKVMFLFCRMPILAQCQ